MELENIFNHDGEYGIAKWANYAPHVNVDQWKHMEKPDLWLLLPVSPGSQNPNGRFGICKSIVVKHLVHFPNAYQPEQCMVWVKKSTVDKVKICKQMLKTFIANRGPDAIKDALNEFYDEKDLWWHFRLLFNRILFESSPFRDKNNFTNSISAVIPLSVQAMNQILAPDFAAIHDAVRELLMTSDQ